MNLAVFKTWLATERKTHHLDASACFLLACCFSQCATTRVHMIGPESYTYYNTISRKYFMNFVEFFCLYQLCDTILASGTD